jgi:hypothetical protein
MQRPVWHKRRRLNVVCAAAVGPAGDSFYVASQFEQLLSLLAVTSLGKAPNARCRFKKELHEVGLVARHFVSDSVVLKPYNASRLGNHPGHLCDI